MAPMRRSIRTRLLILFIALSIVPLVAVGSIIGYRDFSLAQHEALDFQHQTAERVSIDLKAFMQQFESVLQIAIQNGINGANRAQAEGMLQAILSFKDIFDSVALLDNAGQELVAASRKGIITANQLQNRAKADEFIVPVESGKNYYSPVWIDQTNSEPLMRIAVPITNLRTGAIDTVLVADVRFKPVWELIGSLDIEASDTLFVVDSQNKVIAHRDPSVVLRGTRYSVPAEDGVHVGLSGSNVVLASTQLQYGQQIFTIVAERTAREAFATATGNITLTALIILFGLAAASGAGYITVRRLINPVVDLASTAKAISAGDLTKRAIVSNNNNDEIGDLGRAFNSMTARLGQTLEGLQQNVADLEKAKIERERLIAELRETSRLKSEFLSTMSHELRTPLNAILGFTGIILGGMGGTVDGVAQRMIERVDANSKRLLGLINDILDIAKIEAGRMDIVESPVVIRQLVSQWGSQMGVLAGQKGLAFESEVAPDVPNKLSVDSGKLTQIATNLLSNAVKFTERGKISLTLKKDDTQLVLIVSDTGIGIPPHALNFIFDEFRQLDGSTRRAYGGTGLGLAIVRNLCRVMSGTVNVVSKLEEGSTFIVKLPLKPINENPS